MRTVKNLIFILTLLNTSIEAMENIVTTKKPDEEKKPATIFDWQAIRCSLIYHAPCTGWSKNVPDKTYEHIVTEFYRPNSVLYDKVKLIARTAHKMQKNHTEWHIERESVDEGKTDSYSYKCNGKCLLTLINE